MSLPLVPAADEALAVTLYEGDQTNYRAADMGNPISWYFATPGVRELWRRRALEMLVERSRQGF